MVHYKLTYFDFRGLGEVPRMLFHLADVEFEERRLSLMEFVKMKPGLPCGQVPIFEIDGVEISQSSAINRYLARKFGYAGKTPLEEAQVDSISDMYKDFLKNLQRYSFPLVKGRPEEELVKALEIHVKPAMKILFRELNKFLKSSRSGFLVGDSLTWADLQIADTLTTLKNIGVFQASEEPLLESFYQKITGIPKLKEYLDKRPESKI